MNYAGIDYHKEYSFVSILNEQGTVVFEQRVEHQHPQIFEKIFKSMEGECEVVYEACGSWSWLYEILEKIEKVKKISLAHPYQTRIIAAAQIKTDKLDARKLAMLLRADLIPCAYIPERETRQRKDVLRQRIFWVRQRTRVRNRVHRLLSRQHGLGLPQVGDLFGKKGMQALEKVRLSQPDDLLLKQGLKMLESFSEQIKQTEKKIAEDGKIDEEVQWLSSLPGVGLILSNVIATEIDRIERFQDASRLCAYAGLVPSTSSSGGKTYHGRMLSACNKWLKWAFVEASWVAISCSPYFGGIYQRHRQRGKKPNIAISIVAHRMGQIAWWLLKEKRSYEERPLKTFSSVAPMLN